MFDVVQKHTKIMMSLMFLLIIPSFVLFGIDGYNRMSQASVAVARVAGKDITKSEWDAAHKSEADRLRASRPDLDAKLLDSPEARYVTLEKLIRDRVLAAASEKSKLFTSDARLARFSVSYTHLDVYKRQSHCCAMLPVCPHCPACTAILMPKVMCFTWAKPTV